LRAFLGVEDSEAGDLDLASRVRHSEAAMEDEMWGWSEAAPGAIAATANATSSSSSSAAAVAASSTAAGASTAAAAAVVADSDDPLSSALSARRADPGAISSLLRAGGQASNPQLLFPCPRLGVGLELCFSQLHALVYMHSVSAMHLQVP
jgi:hypothetical protein